MPFSSVSTLMRPEQLTLHVPVSADSELIENSYHFDEVFVVVNDKGCIFNITSTPISLSGIWRVELIDTERREKPAAGRALSDSKWSCVTASIAMDKYPAAGKIGCGRS